MKAAVDLKPTLTIIKTEKVDLELFPSPDMECADVPLLTPSSKEMMSQALKATFSGFSKEQQRLGIPKDPRQWTETHVRDWVMWAVNEFSLKGVDFQKFCMNGAALCALGKDCFLELAPDFVGDILWEHLEILQKEDVKPYQVNGVNPTYPESRYTSDYFISYGIEHAQCVPPSEFSEPSFITESYQTLHPISSEELLSLKYENDYPSVILRDPLQTDTLQTDYFAIKQEVVTPDNMCMGRTSRGKLGGQDSFESVESYDSCDRLTQSWSSQSSFNSLQRVPSYDSFDSEDYPAALPNHKPKGTFKDYVRDRADLNKDKPVIPAAALAGYTEEDSPWGKQTNKPTDDKNSPCRRRPTTRPHRQTRITHRPATCPFGPWHRAGETARVVLSVVPASGSCCQRRDLNSPLCTFWLPRLKGQGLGGVLGPFSWGPGMWLLLPANDQDVPGRKDPDLSFLPLPQLGVTSPPLSKGM
uniref:ETS proto-onco 1, transcription factor n=2 Tax=Canis lupus familiaris TaxID=9615 RepID=A0A8P0TB62_CANLF